MNESWGDGAVFLLCTALLAGKCKKPQWRSPVSLSASSPSFPSSRCSEWPYTLYLPLILSRLSFLFFFFFYQFLSLRVNMAVCRCARMCLHARVFWVIKLHRFISCYNTNHSLNNGWALMEGICQTSDVKPQDLALTCSHTETQTHTSGWWVRDRLETDCTDGQRQTYL